MTVTEQLAIDLFNRKHGSELTSRFEKLKEEADEVFEAFNGYMNRDDCYEHVVEELGDLKAVLTHICGILQLDQDKLLLDAIVKSEIRDILPDYKRK